MLAKKHQRLGVKLATLVPSIAMQRAIVPSASVAVLVLAFPFCTPSAAQQTLGIVTPPVAESPESIDPGAKEPDLAAIDIEDLKSHVGFLADDSLEGREAGSRGGRAAGNYLIESFKTLGLEPLGEDGGFVQTFGAGYRNVLGYLEGSDPTLKDEFIVIGAHYDHVGYGNASNSYGPTGRIHNGADDNASGTAAMLEIVQGLVEADSRPARSILIALWDGEEKGLLGSIHWVNSPTVELSQVKLMINIDMIGRLRGGGLEVYGTRTAPGLRRLTAMANSKDLKLVYDWDISADSDHHPFFTKRVPILMYHTGLHGQYHRPSDDTNTLNWEGLRDVAQLTLQTAWTAANATQLGEFRRASSRESESSRRRFESSSPSTRQDRLGASFLASDANGGVRDGVVISSTESAGPARMAGLKPGDRITKVGDVSVGTEGELRTQILKSPTTCPLTVRRADGETSLVDVNLRGKPIRVGLSWLPDGADASIVLVTEVIPHSPAAMQGIRVGDRIHAINNATFEGSKDLLQRLLSLDGEVSITTERNGRLSTVVLDLGEPFN